MRKISVLGIKKIIGPRPLGGRSPGAPPLDPLVIATINTKKKHQKMYFGRTVNMQCCVYISQHFYVWKTYLTLLEAEVVCDLGAGVLSAAV